MIPSSSAAGPRFPARGRESRRPEARPGGSESIRTLRFELSTKTVFVLVAVAASIWLVIRLRPVLLVLVVALFIVGTMGPVVRWLEGRRVGRGAAIAIVFTLLFVGVLLVVGLTLPALIAQAAALLEHEPAMRARVVERLAKFPQSMPLANWLRNLKYDVPAILAGPTAVALSMQAIEVVAYGASALFLALYAMIERDRLRGSLFAVVPRSRHMRLSRVLMSTETIVGAYIRGQLITSLLMASFTFVLLSACGVENAMALAVFAGVADVLPYIGVFLSVGPAVLAALPHGTVIVVVVLLSMLAYEEFESRILVPRIYGGALRLPSTVVLFALLAGATLMGVLGALLALPFAAFAVMVVEELRVELPGEQEQVADVDQRADDDRGEREYERRTAGVPAEQAAAIAVEISADRRKEELLVGAEPAAAVEADAQRKPM